jgi:hypothetical protein
MDQDTRTLIMQLSSYAGAMMEDASVPALTVSGIKDHQIPALFEDLNRQVRHISALLAAAMALAEFSQRIQ